MMSTHKVKAHLKALIAILACTKINKYVLTWMNSNKQKVKSILTQNQSIIQILWRERNRESSVQLRLEKFSQIFK